MKKFVTLLLLVVMFSGTLGAKQSSWKFSKDGWALRKAPNEKHYRKFFPIGLWNVPGYTKKPMEADGELYRRKCVEYLNTTQAYNTLYATVGTTRENMKRLEVTGSMGFYFALKNYEDKMPVGQGPYRQYTTRLYMDAHPAEPGLVGALDSVVNSIVTTYGSIDHIWAPIDEIAGGGAGSGWCWTPAVGEKIKERIKKREPHTLIYTDLVGVSRGNFYLFQRKYLQTHTSMPATPPFEAVGEETDTTDHPMRRFARAYDGRQIYDKGTANYTNYDLPALKDLFYNNLKICAQDYRKCGDVFGINSFIDFNEYPVLAGVTVDAIKAGAGSGVPVWLFFDGNGYAVPSGENTDYFVGNLKCQIYTSIIHGATGVMFWNDRSNSPDIFNALEKVVTELAGNEKYFLMETEKTYVEGDLHYMIKKGEHVHTLIASNTSKAAEMPLNVPLIGKKTLKPLEVYIASF